jgi:hypothetical protein
VAVVAMEDVATSVVIVLVQVRMTVAVLAKVVVPPAAMTKAVGVNEKRNSEIQQWAV